MGAYFPPRSVRACRPLTAYSRKSGRRRLRLSRPPLACGFALIRRVPVGASSFSSGISLPFASNSSSGFCARIHFSRICSCSGFFFTSAIGTWCARQEPSSLWPSTSGGAVQPFGVRSTIIGQRGRLAIPGVPGFLLMLPDFGNAMLHGRRHRLVHGFGIGAFDEVGRPAVAAEQVLHFLVADASQQCGVVDLVSVEMKNRQNRAVTDRD